MIAVLADHTSRGAFYWNSDLSNERKDEIISWVTGLDEMQTSMLADIIRDVQEEKDFQAADRDDMVGQL